MIFDDKAMAVIEKNHPGKVAWVAIVYPSEYSRDGLVREWLMTQHERETSPIIAGDYLEVGMAPKGEKRYYYRATYSRDNPGRIMLTPSDYWEAAGIHEPANEDVN
jgi:hypothetical protein